MSRPAQRELLEEAIRLLGETRHHLADVERLHDDKYMRVNAAARAQRALAQIADGLYALCLDGALTPHALQTAKPYLSNDT